MNIKKLKVRPRKDYAKIMCAPQLTSMLACWAATNDIHSTAACQEHAKALHECMRTAPMGGKQHGPTINYHLMRLNKILK